MTSRDPGSLPAFPRVSPAICVCILLALTLFAYWRAPGTEFIGDDSWRIVTNRHLLQQGFQASLTRLLPDRPVLTMTILLNFALGGLNPWGYKVFSLALHLAVGLVFFALLLRLQKRFLSATDPVVPAVFAAAFLTHPLATQAVLSSIQRGVLLAALGGLGSVLFFLEYLTSRKKWFYLLALLCYILGILSKSFVICVPAILLLSLRLCGEPIRPLLWHFVPFLLASGLPVIPYYLWGVNRQAGDTVLSWHDYLCVQTRVVWTYLKLFVIPTRLHFEYEIDPNPSLLKNFTWLAIAGHAAVLSGGALLMRHGRALAGFGTLAMYLAFFPESGVFAIGHLAFEHRAYFPLLFFLLALFALARSFPGTARGVAVALLPVPVLFSLMTRARIDEVATTEKWLLNSYRYQTHSRRNNLALLTGLYSVRSFALCGEICRTMIAADPAFAPYSLYLRILTFPDDSPAVRRETVGLVGTALLQRRENWVEDDTAASQLLTFLIKNSAAFSPDPLADQQALGAVFQNQLPRFLADPEFFHTPIQQHQGNLSRLMAHYEDALRTGDLPQQEFVRYLDVLGQWGIYFPEARAAIAGRFEDLRNAYPGRVALINASEESCRELMRRVGAAGSR